MSKEVVLLKTIFKTRYKVIIFPLHIIHFPFPIHKSLEILSFPMAQPHFLLDDKLRFFHFSLIVVKFFCSFFNAKM